MNYASMAIAILGLTTYQLAMKAAPRAVNPFWLLTFSYALASCACIPAALAWRRFAGTGDAGPSFNLARAALPIAGSVILIEIGYLLIYRSGWSLSVAPGLAQAVTLSLLFVLGLAFFGEQLSLGKAIGLLLALGGVFLLSRK